MVTIGKKTAGRCGIATPDAWDESGTLARLGKKGRFRDHSHASNCSSKR
jgi:hypothetical protein